MASKAVHLDQEGVEGLLALVVPASKAGSTMPSHRVDLVDEDDAGGVGFALLEQVTDPGRSHTDEHLDEVGPGHLEERPRGLSRHGAGQQRLSGARRTHEQDTLGQPATKARKPLRVLEELDDLFELFLRFVRPGDVREGARGRVRREELRLGASELERPVSPTLHWCGRSRSKTR